VCPNVPRYLETNKETGENRNAFPPSRRAEQNGGCDEGENGDNRCKYGNKNIAKVGE
jgi:hypothetical protein